MELVKEEQMQNGWYPNLDPEGDMIGVRLDKPVICGECLVEMKEIGKGRFQCPECGKIFQR